MRSVVSLLFIFGIILIIFGLTSVHSTTHPVSIFPTPTPAVLGTVSKSSGCTMLGGLPDRACTPGQTDPSVTQATIETTICKKGYTATVRPPSDITNAIKTQAMQMYGDTDAKSNYELDHLIPLELGGCASCTANLWPEPYAISLGAREKDQVENYLRRQVCEGVITLQDAQVKIANNWVAVYGALPR